MQSAPLAWLAAAGGALSYYARRHFARHVPIAFDADAKLLHPGNHDKARV
ncbi:hypothetical protein HMPREF1985_00139 [Mitsuokella sp. oral taxon 131 str. W9106]|nr:hypothetical protein HMPREF1985_00139 [Mitsuokella sp. oral taxon 131 str. W9106]